MDGNPSATCTVSLEEGIIIKGYFLLIDRRCAPHFCVGQVIDGCIVGIIKQVKSLEDLGATIGERDLGEFSEFFFTFSSLLRAYAKETF